MSDVDPGAEIIRLRPGAAIYEISTDELQISFPNYTATFTSPDVTNAVRAILAALDGGAPRASVIETAAAATGFSPDVIDYLVDSLLGSNCLYVGSEEQIGTPLREFQAYIGDADADFEERLANARCVLVQPAGDRGGIAEALAELEVKVDVIEATPGESSSPPLDALREALASATVVGCWNVPYRSPFARTVNEIAIQHPVPVLFGTCEGIVGRVGPFVLPGNTACLECLNDRLLSLAGGPELRAYRAYRLRNEEIVPPPWPSHPLFVRAVAALFGVELLNVALRRPSVTSGGFVEYRLGDAGAERHPVLRVPGCPMCRPQSSKRLAWDVRFQAPAVKGSA